MPRPHFSTSALKRHKRWDSDAVMDAAKQRDKSTVDRLIQRLARHKEMRETIDQRTMEYVVQNRFGVDLVAGVNPHHLVPLVYDTIGKSAVQAFRNQH